MACNGLENIDALHLVIEVSMVKQLSLCCSPYEIGDSIPSTGSIGDAVVPMFIIGPLPVSKSEGGVIVEKCPELLMKVLCLPGFSQNVVYNRLLI